MFPGEGQRLVDSIRYKVKEIAQSYKVCPDNLDVRRVGIIESAADEICYRASCKVYGRDVDQIRFPSNWIEAFKARWFPKFLKKKFPVQFSIIKIEALLPLRVVKEETIVMHVEREET